LDPAQARDKALHPYVAVLAAKLRRVLGQCKREGIIAIEWGPGFSDHYNTEPSYEVGKRSALGP
jgi:hypothetical protein